MTRYKTILLALFFFLMAFPAFSLSGNNTIDQLLFQCEHARSNSNYASLSSLSQKLKAQSRSISDKRGLGYAYFYEGLSLMFTGKGGRAEQSFDTAWNLGRETHNDSIGALVMNARGIYQALYNNNNFLAQRFFFMSLDLAESAHYENLKIRVYGNLLILSQSAIGKDGFNHAKRIYQYGLEHKDIEQEYMGVYYLALYYKQKGNYTQAQKYVRRALQLYNRHHYNDIASVYVLYSEIETQLGHLDQAYSLALKADTLAKQYSQTSLLVDVYVQLARVLHLQGDYAGSNSYARQALAASEEHSFSNRVIDCYRIIADNDIKMGNKEEAVSYLLKANAGMETESRMNMSRLMNEREMLDKLQKQELQDEAKRQQIAAQHRAILMMIVVSLILLVALVAILLVLRSRNLLIKRIVRQNVQKVESQEKARLRIAELEKQLSDETHADKLSARLPDDSERMQQLYDRICELMDKEKPYKTPQLTREKLAAMVGTNRTYLSTVIREKSGMSYQQFINSYRIGEAVRILSDRNAVDYPLKQLYADLGFTSPSTFYKLFQQSVGITPSVYRKQFIEIEEEKD